MKKRKCALLQRRGFYFGQGSRPKGKDGFRMARTHLFTSNPPSENTENDLLQQQKNALKNTALSAEAPVERPAAPLLRPVPPAAVSILSKDLELTGSLKSASRIEILGTVNGDVTCGGDVFISGVVTGNVSASALQITSGRVKGNVTCQKELSLDENSTVEGNVRAESIACGGKVTGNLTIQDKAELKGGASVFGDVSARLLSVEEGAVLQGELCIGEALQKKDAAPKPLAERVLDIDGRKYL